jgi:hypothetical protein
MKLLLYSMCIGSDEGDMYSMWGLVNSGTIDIRGTCMTIRLLGESGGVLSMIRWWDSRGRHGGSTLSDLDGQTAIHSAGSLER